MATYMKNGTDKVTYISRDEMDLLVAELTRKAKRSPERARLLLILEMSVYLGGFRLEEICGLTLRDCIEGAAGLEITVRPETSKGIIKDKKTGKKLGMQRTVQCSWEPATQDKLRELIDQRWKETDDPDAPLFPCIRGAAKGTKMSGNTLYRSFKRCTQAILRDKATRDGKRVHEIEAIDGLNPHAMRHSFAIFARESGISDAAIVLQGGWKHISTMLDHYANAPSGREEIIQMKR